MPQNEKMERRGEGNKRKMERGQNFLSLISRSKEEKNGTVRAALVYSYFWIDYYFGM